MAKPLATINLSSLLPIAIVLTSLFPAIFPAEADGSNETSTDFIKNSCCATTYPDVCFDSLFVYAAKVNKSSRQLARVAVSVSLAEARNASAYVSYLRRSGAARAAKPRELAALGDCIETFGDAVGQMRQSIAELRQLSFATTRFQLSNVQTWMSAALTNEDTCLEGFDGVSSSIKDALNSKVSNLKQVTSNALALVNSLASKVTGNR